MKIVEQTNSKLIVEHSNQVSKIVLFIVAVAGIILLGFYLQDETDVFLYMGLLLTSSGIIGYSFINTVRLSVDKINQQVVLIKYNLLKRKVDTLNFMDIDNFIIKKVITETTSGEYGSGSSTYYYLNLVKNDGEVANIFIHNSSKRLNELLSLILYYFIK